MNQVQVSAINEYWAKQEFEENNPDKVIVAVIKINNEDSVYGITFKKAKKIGKCGFCEDDVYTTGCYISRKLCCQRCFMHRKTEKMRRWKKI